MRVLHIIDELKVGGAQTHLETMLRAAQKLYPGFEHTVVGLTAPGPIGERIKALAVRVEVMNLAESIRRRRFDRAVKAISAMIRSEAPDVVEAHLTFSRLLALPAAAALRIPVRIGYEQGDTYLRSLPFRVANMSLQFAAQRIVVCSDALADWAHHTHRIMRSRLWVLHNCVDVSRFCVRPNDTPDNRFGWPARSTVFAAVGSLGTGVNKRVDVCIQALAIARRSGADARLLICGDGSQRAELESLTEKLMLTEHVRFLGVRSDVHEILQNCDVFCHAAPFEPFGIVCVEAMATALPTLVPSSGGMREAVIHGETGLVYEALNADALAACMTRLTLDPSSRRVMGLSGRARAESHFSADAYVKVLYETYATILAKA